MQGDDVVFTTQSVGMVEALVYVYQLLGYKVHTQKTFISRDRAEFLRRSYERSGITGYTPRTLLTIRFRNPVIPLPLRRSVCIPGWLRGPCVDSVVRAEQ